jgi:hypothetical protein
MSKIEKRLEKWKTVKQPVPKEQVITVLERLFPGNYEFKGGSHIVVKHPSLRGLPGFPEGRFNIAVWKGRKVKRWYLKDLIKVIEYLVEKGEIRKEEVH